MNSLNDIPISIIVTCHAEGILLHKTLKSIMRSAENLSDVRYEIIVHIDNPTSEMLEYTSRIDRYFKDIQVFTNNFGDPGMSRDFCIHKARGKYIALIDGDDLMSRNWLKNAYEALESREYGSTIAHSEMTVEFGGFNSIVQKYPSIDNPTDSLLNVWSARWNAIIFAPTNILKEIGYPHNQPGYGYEDWLVSCTFITKKIDNILIPETVMFVRRKEENSVWDTMRAARLVLPKHEIYSFDTIREMELPSDFLPNIQVLTPSSNYQSRFKSTLKQLTVGSPIEGISRRAHGIYKRLVLNPADIGIKQEEIPKWLLDEWRDIHEIERQIFPSQDILDRTKIYHSITELHYRIGGAYKKAVDFTRSDKYDYVILVPWLISGGADLFAINYANAVAKYDANKRVLVIATMQGGRPSVWKTKLDSTVDFVPLNDIFDEYKLEHEHQNRVLEQLIENSGATHIHVLNSILGYDFIRQHKAYILGSLKKVIITSFSQSTDETRRIFGFSHTHVPYVYDLATYITTDNSAVRDMWIDSYGFDDDKILIHRPLIDIKSCERSMFGTTTNSAPASTKVLWAARLAPEKLPSLVVEIAKEAPEIHFDMYGNIDQELAGSFLDSLPSNVTYKGEFDGFFSLPVKDYSAYLYTSLFDGLPNALVEASVAKLPIVASAVGGIPEYIGTDKGILVNDIQNPKLYATALRKLLSDKTLAASLTKRAYQGLGEGFNDESHYRAIASMLKKIDY